jgi:glycosyltransferase involved in cell wall biosynthesis
MLYVTGPLEDAAVGYTQAALQYLMSLKTAGYNNFQLSLTHGMANWRMTPPWTEPLSIVRHTTENHNNVAVIHWLPEFLTQPVFMRGKKLNIGLTVPEADRVPAWLIEKFNTTLNGFIVPTAWQRDVLMQSGLKLPCEVLPHTQGAYFWQQVEAIRSQMDKTNEPYTFYYVGTWVKRKNPIAVLRAYLKAFPVARPDVRLVMKISRHKGATDFIRALVGQYSTADRLEQDIQIFDEFFTDDQLAWLHAAGDCYVTAHKSEGWGIGSFQAALVGNRVISTDWSAPVSYLQPVATGGVDLMVPYSMTPVDVDSTSTSFMFASPDESDQPMWAAIDEDALVEAYRTAARTRVYRTPEATARLRYDYGWTNVGKQFKLYLERLENDVR